jgi:hypothetical protein
MIDKFLKFYVAHQRGPEMSLSQPADFIVSKRATQRGLRRRLNSPGDELSYTPWLVQGLQPLPSTRLSILESPIISYLERQLFGHYHEEALCLSSLVGKMRPFISFSCAVLRRESCFEQRYASYCNTFSTQ